jgi:hypothetical protein
MRTQRSAALVLLAISIVSGIRLERVCADPQEAPSVGSVNDEAGPTPLDDVRRAGLGAATWIPETVAYFGSIARLGELGRAVWQSRALLGIISLPPIRNALHELIQSEFVMTLERMGLLSIITDAVSHEIFLAADDGIAETLRAFVDMNVWRRLDSELPPIDAILENKEKLRLSPIILGFRLSDPKLAEETLSALFDSMKDSIPFEVADPTIDGVKYRTLRWSGKMLEPSKREDLLSSLGGEEAPAEKLSEFKSFLDSWTAVLGFGVRQSYLILTIGSDLTHLERLGKERSLAESKPFEPVRKNLRPDLFSLSYFSAKALGDSRVSKDEAKSLLDAIDAWLSELPESERSTLRDRVRKDTLALLKDWNELAGIPTPLVAMGFANRGIENLTFISPSKSYVDARRPLELFLKAGTNPLLALGGRSRPIGPGIERLGIWIGSAYRHFKEAAPSILPPGDRAELEKFDATVAPLLGELWSTTKDEFLPQVDGLETLLVVDGLGSLPRPAGTPLDGFPEIRLPRPALVFQHRDPAKLRGAFSRYRTAINAFLATMAESDATLEPFEIPVPVKREFAAGELWSYPMLRDDATGFEPHALISGGLLIVGLFPEHSRSFLESKDAPPSSVVRHSEAAGSAGYVDLRASGALFFQSASTLIEFLASDDTLPASEAMFAQVVIPVLRRSLSALMTFQTRVYEADGHTVLHSWLEVEDI